VLVAQDLSAFDVRARSWPAEASSRLRSMYASAPGPIGAVGRDTFAAIDALARTTSTPEAPSGTYPAGSVGNSLRQAARIVKSGLGTRCIFVNVTGAFDTHSNQLDANVRDYAPLAAALAAFAQDLGSLLDDVVVLVTTEFGRVAYVNGSAGTDHGSGFCMLALGGGVRGGRVYGRWPGLSRSQLHENRDLAVTTDFRDVFQEVARAQFGIAESLFPGYAPGAGPGVIG
jgi:uncharacterized protein (DUF1501 family)